MPKKIEKDAYDYDHPNAVDWDLFKTVVKDLKNKKKCLTPVYDF